MTLPIEDYALIGDTETAALVGRDGSIDWLCLPRFDSPACFTKLLGRPEHGYWRIAPAGEIHEVRRSYRGATLVLQTEFVTDDGVVRLVDCMPPRDGLPDVVRVVEGVSGRVPLRLELVVRFGYGRSIPWVRPRGSLVELIAGPDALFLESAVPTARRGSVLGAQFTVEAGQRVPFRLGWYPSHGSVPRSIDALEALARSERWWQDWAARCRYQGPWREAVLRSLITLKALTYSPTGGIVAAPTTSLPEKIGGSRNWDYRYCWLRDATFTLFALLQAGYHDEARAWREWLLRAVAGDPSQIQIMYGVAGERWLPEHELPWLPGYEHSQPVRIGNGAVHQLQLDVVGELFNMDNLALSSASQLGAQPSAEMQTLRHAALDFLESRWREPDEGIWEIRGPRRHFTHSKLMVWVAFDRAIRAAERHRLGGPIERWKRLRAEIHDEICRRGYDPQRGSFVQYFGGQTLDAALLNLPLVGFLPAADPRIVGTVAAIERELVSEGFVYRYATDAAGSLDGLAGEEGAFIACTFWLAEALAMVGEIPRAIATFERVLAVRNDVGLLSEEYDPQLGRLVGNFPQAFSHVDLIHAAIRLGGADGRATLPPPTSEDWSPDQGPP